MNNLLSHRGPDDAGFYDDDLVSFGHRRLSIIDLSEQGRQPMHNEDSTVLMVVNGEIYNYKALRQELEAKGHIFRSNSDSETIVHVYEEYGEDFVLRLDGMFAIALWDSKKGKLLLVRDRLGIKPLYYAQSSTRFIFASEIKAILQDPGFIPVLNEEGFFQYLAFQSILTAETMFKGIYKLEPATILIYKDRQVTRKKYWSLDTNAVREAEEAGVAKALADAVRSHLVSDVPVGVLLSGGLDSSSIVALLSEAGISPINTFTVGFNHPDDEFVLARRVSEKFKTNHRELIIKPNHLREVIEKIVWHMDEPLADGGAIATYLAGQRIRDFVKVVLVGEGGDETLGGYNWYKLSVFPFSILPKGVRKRMYFYFTTYYKGGSKIPFNVFSGLFQDKRVFFDSMASFEINNILPNSLLMKVDKMTMAHSLEARVPFLDHKFVSLAARIPYKKKISLWGTKKILRKIMKDTLPDDIIRRKKHGFILPVTSWLHNELKDFVYDALFCSGNKTGDFIPSDIKRGLFKNRSTLAAIENNSLLWRLFIFEVWHKRYFKGDAISAGRQE